MSKVSNVNILIPNVATDGAATILYYLKETLKNAGWTILASSDGTTYNSSGDQISSPDAGTNGMNNTSAWFRITDPDNSREFVMMRGNTALNAYIKYSRSSKFSGGSPSATVLPTTAGGDSAVLVGTGNDSTSATNSSALVTTANTARLHIITDNSSTNGVYPWYIYVFQSVTNLSLIHI